jgi:hypothetical protein
MDAVDRCAIERAARWRIGRREPLPAIEYADHLVSSGACTYDDSTNRRIQPWAVATTSEYANPHR